MRAYSSHFQTGTHEAARPLRPLVPAKAGACAPFKLRAGARSASASSAPLGFHLKPDLAHLAAQHPSCARLHVTGLLTSTWCGLQWRSSMDASLHAAAAVGAHLYHDHDLYHCTARPRCPCNCLPSYCQRVSPAELAPQPLGGKCNHFRLKIEGSWKGARMVH